MNLHDEVISLLGQIKYGIVYLITNEKFIQGSITSLLLGVITASTEGMGVITSEFMLNNFGLDIPSKWAMVPILFIPLSLMFWADNNTEEWRELVSETTGEEEAVEESKEESEENG